MVKGKQASMGAADRLLRLDGTRGAAALMVVLSHCAYYGMFPQIFARGMGTMGVVVFYLLSGFLISWLYADRALTRRSLQSYAVARGARVLPLFYAVLLGSLVLLAAFGHSGYAYEATGAFWYNAFLISGSGVLWSIPVEIHFYMVFVLLWWARSHGRDGAAILLVLVIQAALIWILGDAIDRRNTTPW